MKYFTKPLFVLLLIVIFASVLRLYDLGKVPASLNWDEVALGYNAHSILTTGADEYGKFLPAVLQSYDDYKPALYTYLAIPSVGILGLTEGAVRLPSAVAGIGAVAIVYFLVIAIVGNKKILVGRREVPPYVIALVASFFLAISPWHIQFSRIAFESNVGLTINLLGLLLFFKALKKPLLMPFSFMVFALNIHMYQSNRVFTPLLVAALCIIFHKKLLTTKKVFIVSVAFACIVALPLVFYILTNQNALLRAKGVSVFSDQTVLSRSSHKLLFDTASGNFVGKVLDNRRIEFGKAFAGGYISHFDPNWLFITGDIARHHAPYMGLLYIVTAPFLLIGIYTLIFLRIDRRYKIAFFTYFLIVPIPASVTTGVPHAVRTLNFVWTYEVFIALGIIATITFIVSVRERLRRILLIVVAIAYGLLSIVNFSYYLNQYFVQLNYYNAVDWMYGYKQAISFVEKVSAQYDTVIVENEVPFDQSYMFFLFYLKVDPSYYQKTGGTLSGGYKEKHKGFYNYTFESVKHANYTGKNLYIGKEGDMPKGSSIKKIIYYPDGGKAVVIAEYENREIHK